MLALASVTPYSFNPVQAVVTNAAAVSIVGLDVRAIKSSVANLHPQRVIQNVVERIAQPIVMVADATPKVVGDYGFDPLGLGNGGENFSYMREAELKHGRLAMMAAVAWPLQEIFHPILADSLNAPDKLVASGGASPSLLNGGLFQVEFLPALAAFTLGCTYLEVKDLAARKELDCAWNEYPAQSGVFGRLPGNFGFDPLNFYRPLKSAERIAVQERELLNGRLAMCAVASYVATEFVGQTTIVRATPDLFRPLFLAPWFRELMDASFGMASMDGSIDGVAF